MTRVVDPDEVELAAVQGLADLNDKFVLDIGCGDGRTSRRLARTAASVLGVDPDTAAVAQARQSSTEYQTHKCRYLAADVLTLDLEPASFDIVVFSRSL